MSFSILPSEFQILLRYALLGTTRLPFSASRGHQLQIAKDEGFSPGRSEGFKRLIEGVHFSKRFILSYQLVLLALLLLFTISHWGSRLLASRRRRRKFVIQRSHGGDLGPVKDVLKVKGNVVIQQRSSGSSSSSSTLGGDAMLEDVSKGVDERTMLLPKSPTIQPAKGRFLSTGRFKAWFTYQPRPMPSINKTLPSNGTSLSVIAFIGLQIFYSFFRMPLSLSMLFVFADRTSLLFVANLPLLYLFAAKNQPIKFLTGYSYEALNVFHRRLGEILCLLALLHSGGMIGVWYTILRPAGIALAKFLLMKMILLGIGALVAYEMIYFTSLGSFRQKWYELFLGLHVVLQTAALVLVWFHHHGSRPYVGVALVIFLLDRLVYRMAVKSKTFRGALRIMNDGNTVAVSASIPKGRSRSLVSYVAAATDISAGWKPTDHVFLSVPALSHKHIIQAHPFTIASAAPFENDDEAKLELLIRAQDGFSADLLHYAKTHDAVAVRLDGPYGSQSAVHMLQDSDHAVLVAGGSGIAVTWPLVWSVLKASRVEDDENPRKFAHSKRILFVWIIREQSHLSWLDPDMLTILAAQGVTLDVSPPTAEYGHPDISALITNWCLPLKGRVGVVASGPDGLNRSVRNTCASLIRQGHDVNVEVEKFGW